MSQQLSSSTQAPWTLERQGLYLQLEAPGLLLPSDAAALGAALIANAATVLGSTMRSRRAAPVQAPEVTITTPRFDMIAGNEHVRRAAEVALAGGHPICLIGGWEAQAFAAVVDHYGGTAYAIQPCFCGNYGDPEQSCSCTLEQIAAYAIRPDLQEALAAPITVEAVRAPTEKILTILAKGRFGEADELLLKRMEQAIDRPLPPPSLDETCQSLMKAALRQLHLDQGQAERMVTLAQTIARLANQPRIGPAHLAEALQYRRRR